MNNNKLLLQVALNDEELFCFCIISIKFRRKSLIKKKRVFQRVWKFDLFLKKFIIKVSKEKKTCNK